MSLLVSTRRTILSGASIDPDAAAFFARAEIADSFQRQTVNTLVLSLKGAGLWGMFYALYPFVGGTATAHAQNLISASYAITWVNAPTQNSNGVTFNGTTQYGDCSDLTGNSVWPHLSGHGVYVRSDSDAAGVRRMCGATDGALFYTVDRSSGTSIRACAGAVVGYMTFVSVPVKPGHLSAHRTGTTSSRFYDNGTEVATYLTSDSSTPPALNSYLGAINLSGAANSFWQGGLSAAYVSQGMTGAQVDALTTILEAYQDALGRGVV